MEFFNKPTLGGTVSGIGSLYEGFSIFQESKQQAEELEYQGTVALSEAYRNASIIREEGRHFAATQSLQFIGSGVELMGSALITLEQTKKFANTEAKAVEASGEAKNRYAIQQAETMRNQGRASLLSGIVEAGVSIFSLGA